MLILSCCYGQYFGMFSRAVALPFVYRKIAQIPRFATNFTWILFVHYFRLAWIRVRTC